MGKVRKIYKLNDEKDANRGWKKRNIQEAGLVSESEHIDDRKELEAIVLGLMALRGQS